MHYSLEYRFDLCNNLLSIRVTRGLLRGFAKLKKFQKSKNNLEVGVQVPFG